MAAADYYLCDKCDAKTFYDANLTDDWWSHNPYEGLDMAVLCEKCSATHEVVIVERKERETSHE